MEATILLCDFAEAINGKLYIMGGGWSMISGPDLVDCAVAIRIAVPWTQTNQKHALSLRLVTEDGQPVKGADNNPVVVDGEFEVGRPPGAVPGSEIVNVLAVRFAGLPLPNGGYSFDFLIHDIALASAKFHVFRPPDWEAPR